jgi:hypothetical protein
VPPGEIHYTVQADGGLLISIGRLTATRRVWLTAQECALLAAGLSLGKHRMDGAR